MAEADTSTGAAGKKLRLAQTSSVFFALFTLGMVSAVTGTTLLDLSQLFNSTVELTSLVLTVRSVGLLFGSLLSSLLLYRHLNGKLCLVATMVLGGAANALVPASRTLIGAHVCLFIAGMSVGVLEVGGNVWLVQLWREKVAPVFQMYHLSFGLGALFSPVISEPFLSKFNETANALESVNNSTALNETLGSVDTNLTALALPTATVGADVAMSGLESGTSSSRVSVPFAIFGTAYALVGAYMLLLYCVDNSNLRQEEEKDRSATSKNDVERRDGDTAAKVPSASSGHTSSSGRTRFEYRVIGHLLLCVFVQVALESTLAQMFSVYAVQNKRLGFDKSDASFLVATFWGFYTSGRFVAIFLSFKLHPIKIITAMHSIAVLGAAVLLSMGLSVGWSLWLTSTLMGFGLAPLYGSVMSWAVRYVHLKFEHMTLVLIASCMGQMVPPLTVALWINSNPAVFVYVITGWMVLHTANLTAMRKATKGQPEIFEKQQSSNGPATPSTENNANDEQRQKPNRDDWDGKAKINEGIVLDEMPIRTPNA